LLLIQTLIIFLVWPLILLSSEPLTDWLIILKLHRVGLQALCRSRRRAHIRPGGEVKHQSGTRTMPPLEKPMFAQSPMRLARYATAILF
jgi:hypothetical protein